MASVGNIAKLALLFHDCMIIRKESCSHEIIKLT